MVPEAQTESDLVSFLEPFSFPPSTISHILSTVYPPVYDGSQPYIDAYSRVNLIFSEFVFTCHTNHIAHAFDNQTFNYRYNSSLGIHTEDVSATFMHGNLSWEWENVVNTTEAGMLQEYITAFVVEGDPNMGGKDGDMPKFVRYGDQSTVLDFDRFGVRTMRDDTANRRCEWWSRVPWL